MKTLRETLLVLLMSSLSISAHADGLMRPVAAGYPKDFLRLRMTGVDVTIVGQWAMTTVYQEFVNEWNAETDGVYSFPLPMNSRATNFYFWSNDTLYRATLKVKEQATNPGTGEGGIDALLNAYLGTNALRVVVNDIPAGAIQRVKLEYISLCDYRNGRISYHYPFNTDQFATYPEETFTLGIHCTSTDDILADTLEGISGVPTVTRGTRNIDLSLVRSKVYPTGDFTFSYKTANAALGLDLFSAANDSMDGHFVLMVKPASTGDSTSILPKNVLFLLDHSSSTIGVTLDQSRMAIQECLRRLHGVDRFNVVTFNYAVSRWAPASLPVTPANIDSAVRFLNQTTASGGSDLGTALETSLATFTQDSLQHLIMVFSDGRTPIDPLHIRSLNTGAAGIFPVGIGSNVNRSRLEMLAYQNYGFPTFLAITDPLYGEILSLFEQISVPVLRDIRMEMGSNAYDILPGTLGSLYSGSRFYLTGRFKTPATTAFSFAGTSVAGPQFFDFPLVMSSDTKTYAFAEKFWAKEKIDELERREDVYGVTDSLKDLLIATSLRYGIRCKYTAYIADKSHPVTGVRPVSTGVADRYVLLGNYPNPFNPGTHIRFLVRSSGAQEVTIRIYNVIGQLIAVLHVRLKGNGEYDVYWEGKDSRGEAVPTGVYYYTIDFHDSVLSGRMILIR